MEKRYPRFLGAYVGSKDMSVFKGDDVKIEVNICRACEGAGTPKEAPEDYRNWECDDCDGTGRIYTVWGKPE